MGGRKKNGVARWPTEAELAKLPPERRRLAEAIRKAAEAPGPRFSGAALEREIDKWRGRP